MGSCQKTAIQLHQELQNETSSSLARNENGLSYREGTNTVLGQSNVNPYTLANMTLAWQNLIRRGIIYNGESNVRTSHLYVKFKPLNSEQYETLHQDTTLSFSDYPIESTISQNGDYYHDPSLPDSVPTYQYTAVKLGYQFPLNIAYEIIDKLYIPEEDNIFQYENGGTNDLFVDQLLNQAYTQTGNYGDTIALNNPIATLANRYTPGGRIRVFDTRLQQWIGMEGVRVQARRWFIVYKAYPNFNGNYRMNYSYKRPCNYSIWFARDWFAVRQNLVNTTYWINGPKITGDWNYDLNNQYQRFAGHIFRGAFRYHDKNIGGLQKPYIFFIPRRNLYIAKDENGNAQGVNWIVLPVMKIWRYKSSGIEWASDEVFSTTCHETAHTSHVLRMNAGPIQYWQVTQQLQESWPVAIEWYLSHIEYNDRGISNYGNETYSTSVSYPNQFAYQYWNGKQFGYTYTSLYINIVDNFNELNQAFINLPTGNINDQISGYSLPFVERYILKHSYGLESLRVELISNLPNGISENQINLLISQY